MSLELPGPAVVALNMVGLPWPGIDEDVLRGWAADVRRFSARVGESSGRSSSAVSALASADPSPPARVLGARWEHYHGVVSGLRGPLEAFARALDVAADAVVAQKGVVIGAAVGLAAAIVVTQGEALFTFGIAEAEVPAEVAAARLVVKAALQELEGVLVGTLIGAAAHEIAAHLSGTVAKLVFGGGEAAAGVVSAKATYDAAQTTRLAAVLKSNQAEVAHTGAGGLARSSSRQLATGGPGGGWREVARAVEQAVLRVLAQIFTDLVHAIGKIVDDTSAVLQKMVRHLKNLNDTQVPEATAVTAAAPLAAGVSGAGAARGPATAGESAPGIDAGPSATVRYRQTPGSSEAEPGPVTAACTQPGCSGTVEDGYCTTCGVAPSKEPYLYEIAKRYGINLRGSGQKIKVVYDPSLPTGVWGVTRVGERGSVIRVGPEATNNDVDAAETIAHEVSHARYLLRNGSFKGQIHGDANSMADGTPWGSGQALRDWIEGNR